VGTEIPLVGLVSGFEIATSVVESLLR